jgi:hypothetical protein
VARLNAAGGMPPVCENHVLGAGRAGSVRYGRRDAEAFTMRLDPSNLGKATPKTPGKHAPRTADALDSAPPLGAKSGSSVEATGAALSTVTAADARGFGFL